MPESTTSQSPQAVINTSGDQWRQENTHNIVQNDTVIKSAHKYYF